MRFYEYGPKSAGRRSSGTIHAYLVVISLILRWIPFPFGIGLQDLVSEGPDIRGKSKRRRGRGYTREVPEQRAAERHAFVALESRFPHSNLGTQASQVAGLGWGF